MSDMLVQVFAEHPDGEAFVDETKRLVEYVLNKEERNAEIRVVYVQDEEIQALNKKYLQHDYVTDVISFPLDEENGVVEGEVYVCIDQAKRQAEEHSVPVRREVSRLVIHGVLHIIGYDDATPDERSFMQQKEDEYLEMFEIS